MKGMNIFTDASIITSSFEETIGCAGAICYEDNNIFKYEIVRDSTNNISELTAIKLAVLLAIENRYNFDRFNIYADSQYAIFGLTKWLNGWINNTENGILYNSSGMPVKNQEIFLSIIKLIIKNKIPINFYHVKGHVNINNFVSVNNATNVFKKSNNVNVSRNEIYNMTKMNNLVDKNTRNLLKEKCINERENIVRGVIQPILTKEDINIYYNLVNLGENKI